MSDANHAIAEIAANFANIFWRLLAVQSPF
jgi:hypothetical protein